MINLDKLYQQAKKNVGPSGRGNSIDYYASNSYIAWKWKVHKEFYRLINVAGIKIEGA